MILRANKKLVDAYLLQRDVSEASRSLETIQLTTLLYYADETPFRDLPKKEQSYANWLKTPDARRDGKDAPLSSEYQRKCLSTARCFMDWLRDAHNYKSITNRWLRTFRRKNMAEPDEPISFTLDEVVRIANTPVNTLAEERIQAGCIFLFLSGMRIKAFLTTPIKAINITKLTVRQWPSLGVHTKMQKKAVTQILDIPEVPQLLKIVRAWDKKVRDALSPDMMWYAPLSPKTGELDPDATVGKYRDTGFRKDLVAFLQKAGLERKSTHKFRHGHIGFLRGRAESYRELEAIANNTMQTMATMLRYGRLNSEQAHTEIEMLCKRKPQQAVNSTSETDISAIMRQLQEMARQQQQLMARLEELSSKGG